MDLQKQSIDPDKNGIGHRNVQGNSILHPQECFECKATKKVQGSSAQHGTDSEAQGQVLEAISKA
ncbi:hypothetical protein DPMN_180071 [Dreissena polymorpha]|uniref:Uncharacterized protein n=1 Tax=Dreissena polymorpha TaxID=45954 RepID=A0A9D4EE11_DREPO|nr:hypothetical protein DPMN_180071 [Dreissena polymorpha]